MKVRFQNLGTLDVLAYFEYRRNKSTERIYAPPVQGATPKEAIQLKTTALMSDPVVQTILERARGSKRGLGE